MKKLDSTITLLNETQGKEQLNAVYEFEEFKSLQNWKLNYISRLESYRELLQNAYSKAVSEG